MRTQIDPILTSRGFQTSMFSSSLLSILFIVGILTMILASPASAVRVTHVFEGEITGARSDGDIGSRYSYTFSYDSTLPGRDHSEIDGSPFPLPDLPGIPGVRRLYQTDYASQRQLVQPGDPAQPMVTFSNPLNEFELVVGGRVVDSFVNPITDLSATFTQEEANLLRGGLTRISVFNDALSFRTSTLSDPAISRREDAIFFGSVILRDSSASLLTDTSLPINLQLAGFNFATLQVLTYEDPQAFFSFLGSVDRVTTTVVPEPTAALLVGLGLVALGIRRIRH